MNNIYNENEKKHAGMIKDLKNLPKIETPENFEFNLMTRINNKNFGKVEETAPAFNWIKFLAPSAVVVSAVILFFIFIPSSQQTDNSFSNQQKKNDNQLVVDNSAPSETQIVNHANPDISKKSSPTNINYSGTAPANNQLNVAPQRIPFGYTRSVSLDDYIKGANNQGNIQRGNIVNGGDTQAPADGFFVVEKPDQNTLKRERARIDSLKIAKMKADSLKKVQKQP